MKVKKRSGRLVNFNANNITKRIKDQAKGLNVESDDVAVKVIGQIADGLTTYELDDLAIQQSASMSTIHPDYSVLASKIYVTRLHKITPETFSESVEACFEKTYFISEVFYEFVKANASKLNKMIRDERDFGHNYFGLMTLERSYLISYSEKIDGKTFKHTIERPQYMWMRTAIEVTGYDIDKIKETYNAMSEKYYTHATPTLFNSGTTLPQLSSCFLLGMKDDSIKGIFETLGDCADISKLAGGIGIHTSNIRAAGSHIKGTNGISNGLVPMLQVFNNTARYVDQGGGKRKGSFAIYMEPWHADIYDILDLKKNTGKEEMRARDLFYALWIPDLFMEKVQRSESWHLFCPNEIRKVYGKDFTDVHGEEFNAMYNDAVEKGLYRKEVPSRELWEKIMESQIETGVPYIGYKDKVNMANNQKNYGVIKSSNLCIEINEYSDDKEQAVCNLASLALPMFVKTRYNKRYFDFDELKRVVKLATKNLDNVIDANYYPNGETETSNMKHRPIGLGVQGLADVFALLKMNFDSDEARALNKKIFEYMYFYALEASNEVAQEKGSYGTFGNSPAAEGELQFDFWGDAVLDEDLDWDNLKLKIKEDGLRNSLLIALMPTASTSQIFDNNEAFEPFTSNMYTRSTLSGTFIVTNKHMVRDLEEAGLWNSEVRNAVMKSNGSIQNIDGIPQDIKDRYKTAYELSMKSVIDMAADRQRFVCQAQSMNLFMEDANYSKITSMQFYAFNKGLKTGMYYLRTKSAVNAIKFTVSSDTEKEVVQEVKESVVQDAPLSAEEYKAMLERSRGADPDDCEMCGS